jgi:cbb3-type cytochrome oxidase cytochrome c subunit
MNYGPLLFLGAFFALAGSWFGLVLTPQMQLGQLQQTNTLSTGATYPLARNGVARQGLDIYRENGCATCHSQQVGQKTTVCDVVLSNAGTNKSKVLSALVSRQLATESGAAELVTKLPETIRRAATKEVAQADVDTLVAAGAKAELWIVPAGPDISRGWGRRRTVAADFLFDSPAMPGMQRVGPDLADVGSRLGDLNWHLRHLYSPKLEVKNSVMPPYRFLFEKRRIHSAPSPDALTGVEVESGFEVVPTEKATALAAYLVSLKANEPLYVAPVTVPIPVESTNNPAATNVVPGQAAAPSK